ncbi:MAG: hypothetical protein AB7D06_18710, partial [Pedobacter sp.]
DYVEKGELVISLAKMWVREIDVRRKVQNDPELRSLLNWRSTESVENLGILLKNESSELKLKCMRTGDIFSKKNKPFIKKLFMQYFK